MNSSFKSNLKKILSFALLPVMVMIMMPLTVFAVSDTWDPSNGIYNISTENDLFAFKDSLDQQNYYEGIQVNLMNDITISEGRTYVSPDSNGDAEAQFCGIFNGNGHTISNLNMVSSDTYTVSFLPFLGDATIKDLTLKDVKILKGKTWNAAFAPASLGDDKLINCHLEGDCTITVDPSFDRGWNYTAGLVADNYMGTLTIEGCTVGDGVTVNGTGSSSSYFSGRKAGGFVAYVRQYASQTTIKNSDNYATVTSDQSAAGFVDTVVSTTGYENTITIIGCRNYGDISTNPEAVSGNISSAGILSYAFQCTTVNIDRCINYGNITGIGESTVATGGIAGDVYFSNITNCFNAGTIKAEHANTIGGLVGHFRTDGVSYYPDQYNSLINCYNEGDVIGGDSDYVGGLVGFIQDEPRTINHSTIRNAYNFGDVSGTQSIGTVTGGVQYTSVSNVYVKQGTDALGSELDARYADASQLVSHIGYYDSADSGGKVYPAEITLNNNSLSESVASTPLDTDLRNTLQKFVKAENSTLMESGDDFRYYPWMVNKVSDPHAVFGYEIENLTPEADKDINGGFLVTSGPATTIEQFLAGEPIKITLTSNVEDTHSLSGVSVVDESGVVVPVTEESPGVYSFIMPESDVTVKGIYTYNYVGSINLTKKYLGANGYVNVGAIVDPEGILKENIKFSVEPYKSFNREVGKTDIPEFTSSLYTIETGVGNDAIEIALPDFTDAGIGDYWYKVSETTGSSAGVGYDGDYYMHVVVSHANTAEPSEYGVSQVTLHKSAPNDDGVYTNEADDKAAGFTNTFGSGSLTVTKEITGNFADRDKTFKITVTLTAPAGKTVTGPITYGANTTIDGGWTGSQEIVLTLGKGESVTFTNIPDGVTYTVKEEDYSSEGYDNPQYVFDNASETGDIVLSGTAWAGNYASGKITDSADVVTVTNSKNATIDVGVILGNAPYAIIILMVIGFGIFMIVRRRRRTIE